MSYGIYTAADYNFFAGVVAAVNSLRFHGYIGGISVINTGLDDWMIGYLQEFKHVEVLSLAPLERDLRFTDVKTSESPVFKGWAYKAFGITHYNRYERFTFIDADFYPMCNLENEVMPFLLKGKVVATEDGENTWGPKHEEMTGVLPGKYMNVNAGFLSFDMSKHGYLLMEWRNLMTRKKPFDLWYGDQGAINVIMDKYQAEKQILDKRVWNQTHMNTSMATSNAIYADGDILRIRNTNERIYAWHGTGWHKLWHCFGIDHYRNDAVQRIKFYNECQTKVPLPIVSHFNKFLFLDRYNRPLQRQGHLLT